MTRPKFAYNEGPVRGRRPRPPVPDDQNSDGQISDETAHQLEGAIAADKVETFTSNETVPSTPRAQSITDFMQQQMRDKEREPTRPITLRFEESLWQRVEKLRGNLSKNDFFKELVNYYDEHASPRRR